MFKKIFFLKFIIVITLLVFLKIDYRFDYSVNCCSDDFDYYMHASTIALDFDLEYSNQFDGQVSYKKFGKQTPIGFVGSGIFSAPFLFIGNLVDEVLNIDQSTQLMNYKLYFYSLSPIVYFFLSLVFLIKFFELTNIKINRIQLFIYIFGSGLPYFAFERFSMTHVYEVFSISVIFYLSALCFDQNKKIYEVILPIFLLLSFLTRMSNFYIFILPYIIKKLFFTESKHILLKKFGYIASSIFSIILYFLISNKLYGKLIINPAEIYGNNENFVQSLIFEKSLNEIIFSLVKTLKIVLFSYEFGLFWFSPVIFFGFFISILLIIKKRTLVSFLIFMCFVMNFGLIHIWQSAASSYGYRYLYSLIPLSVILIFFQFKNQKVHIFIIFMSIISIFLLLFFETSLETQLSTGYVLNSFNKLVRYSQPNYLLGAIEAVFSFKSYLIIFSTSFLGSIFFKSIFKIFSYENIMIKLEKLNLPTDNSDFQELITSLESISFIKLLLPILIFYLFSNYLYSDEIEKKI